MTWNNRVVKRVYRKGSIEETLYEIHECFYEGKPGPDNEARSCTIDPIDPHGETLEELRETLVRMLAATYQPVLDYDAIGGKRAP